MNFQSVKGTRDFYPELMRLRNWITDTWRRVSLRNGFDEYDSPIFEYLDLYTVKSGEGIVSELFNLTDRGGRNLAIRPEITPSLARMVNSKINSLPRPIKWFSVPRLCRAENPQKGRLREFFQWNCDIIGEDSELADAECIYVLIDALREMGLSRSDVMIRYSSRDLLTEVLRGVGIGDERIPATLALLDKKKKLPPETFAKMLVEAVVEPKAVAAIAAFMDNADPQRLINGAIEGVEFTDAMAAARDKLMALLKSLQQFGVADWCVYDPGVVRGLAYYTGVVYEAFDAGQSLRAVAGGGRYDNLLEVLGGPKVGAVGFGMGDVVVGILLEEKGKVPAEIKLASLDYFVIDGENTPLEKVLNLVSQLRARGLRSDFSYKRQNVGKQLKEANRRGAKFAAIVRENTVAVKNLASGEQSELPVADFISGLGR